MLDNFIHCAWFVQLIFQKDPLQEPDDFWVNGYLQPLAKTLK